MTNARRSRRSLTAASLCGALCATGVVLMVRGGSADAGKGIPLAPQGVPAVPGPGVQTAPVAAVPGGVPMSGMVMPGAGGQPVRDRRPLFEVADGATLPGYEVKPLADGLATGQGFEPRALNNRGEIVGAIVEPGRDGERLRRHAVIYRNGRFDRIEPIGDFGRLSLTDINDRGQATGTLVRYRRGAPPLVHVARVAGGEVTDLGTLGEPTFTDSTGRQRAAPVQEFGPRIDGSGRVVVRVGDSLLRWTSGKKVERLGRGFALDVSPSGHVAGATGADDGSATVWLNDGTPVAASRGVARELHELTSDAGSVPDRSVVETVNDRQQAVVAVEVGTGGFSGRRMTLYYLWDGARRSRLAVMRGPQSGARINGSGDVAGFSSYVGEGRSIPYLYRKGKLYDLRAAVLRSSEWQIDAVTALNDRGQMIAFGRKEIGTFRPLLLTPVEKPLSATASPRPGAPSPRRASSAVAAPAPG